MQTFPLPFWVIPAVLLGNLVAIAFEVRWSWRSKTGAYNLKETLANLGIFVGSQTFKVLLIGWQVFWVGVFAEFRVFDLVATGPLQTVALYAAAFVLTDFCYYWMHRAMHESKVMWAFHLVHHSSPWMNLTTSYRLNWFSPLVAIFFYAPLGLLGFSADVIGACLVLGLLYQFWLHTEAVGRVPVVEGWLNTPSAHRVHHGQNEHYLDKNYGGVFMVWDRLFGTYAVERESVVYGVTTGFHGHNPIKLVFHGFVDLVTGRMGRG